MTTINKSILVNYINKSILINLLLKSTQLIISLIIMHKLKRYDYNLETEGVVFYSSSPIIF